MSASMELPRYRSHKEVWAQKIKQINHHVDGSATIVPEEPGYEPLKVSGQYYGKHAPAVGGYYVRYADGYESWSPAQAFEEGYTRV